MAVFRASKSEDVMDRCNNFWTVLIFLTLSMVTWFVLLCDKPPTPDDGSGSNPKFEAHCWGPVQFTRSHVNYANAVCGKAFNELVNGRNKSEVLYKPMGPESVSERPDINKNVINASSSELDSDNLPTEGDDVPKRHTEHLPYALFFFAVAMTLPYILRKIFSGCIGFVNVNTTLECATKAGYLEESERARRIQELARCTAQIAKSRPRSCVLGFIVTKILCCCVLLAALITEHTLSVDGNTNTNENKNMGISPNQPLMCDFPIRQISNVHHYSLQCSFSNQQSEVTSADIASRDLYLIPLSNAVMIYLFVLFGANVVSVVIWLCRLTMRQRQPPSTDLAPGTALDLHFLLLLSHDNAGPLVTKDLALALKGGGSGEAADGL